MDVIADILLISGAAAVALYCLILSRRLRRFNDLEGGVGGAIAALSSKVDDMTKSLNAARSTAEGSNTSLEGLTLRAERVAKRLEVLVASMHDIPAESEPAKKASPSSKQRPTQVQTSGFKSARQSLARHS